MASNFARQASARARKAARLALNEIGRRIVADIRFSIGIMVQKVGSELIRSDPGEPPRREPTWLSERGGFLWKSIKYKTLPGATTLDELLIYTSDIVAVYMEFGTGTIEPRPFWEPARRRAKRWTGRVFRQLFAENFNRSAPGAEST